ESGGQPGGDPVRLRILRLVEASQITAEEGARLLAAIEPDPATATLRAGRWLRVQLLDTRSGQLRFGVNLPLGLIEAAARSGLKLGARSWGDESRIGAVGVMEAIRAGARGTVWAHDDPERGERLEVRVS